MQLDMRFHLNAQIGGQINSSNRGRVEGLCVIAFANGVAKATIRPGGFLPSDMARAIRVKRALAVLNGYSTMI